MGILPEFDETRCILWLNYGLNERLSTSVIVQENILLSIPFFLFVTPCQDFSTNRWPFLRGYIQLKFKLTADLHLVPDRECVEVYLNSTVINYDIYFIVALRQSDLHQFQAVILEDCPSDRQ